MVWCHVFQQSSAKGDRTMKTTVVTPLPAPKPVPDGAPPDASGLLDLRTFFILAISLLVATAAAVVAGLVAAHSAGIERLPIGGLTGFVAFVATFIKTANGISGLIKD